MGAEKAFWLCQKLTAEKESEISSPVLKGKNLSFDSTVTPDPYPRKRMRERIRSSINLKRSDVLTCHGRQC